MSVADFDPATFFSRYVRHYFVENFERLSSLHLNGCVDDIDAPWNLFVFVDEFLDFVQKLGWESPSLKEFLDQYFVIPVDHMHPDLIQGYLNDRQVSAIIVSGLNKASVPLLQLMFRLFYLQIDEARTDCKLDDFNKVIADARLKAQDLGFSYFKNTFEYVIRMCLRRCTSKQNLRIIKNILRNSDLLEQLREDISLALTNLSGNQPETLTLGPVTSSKQQKQYQPRTPPPKKPKEHSAPIQSKTAHQWRPAVKPLRLTNRTYSMSEHEVYSDSLQRLVVVKPSKQFQIKRTIFEVKNKKFIPKKVPYSIQSTLASPLSRKTKHFLDSRGKRSHSMTFNSNSINFQDLDFHKGALVKETPIRLTQTAYPATFMSSGKSFTEKLSYDISPKKKVKRS